MALLPSNELLSMMQLEMKNAMASNALAIYGWIYDSGGLVLRKDVSELESAILAAQLHTKHGCQCSKESADK